MTISRGAIALVMSRTLPGPPDVVWQLITDWEHQDDWMLELSNVVVISPHREGLGVEAEGTVQIGGIKTRDRIRVTGWEPERLLRVEHRGWVSGGGELRLTPLPGDRTLLAWREELHPPLGLLGAIGLRIFRPLMRRIFVRDLRILEGLVRARTAGSRGLR